MAGIGHNSGEDNAGGDGDGVVPGAGDFNRTMTALANLAMERKDLSEREREVVKAFQHGGGSKFALRFLRQVEKLDPDERASALAEIDKYLAYKQYF